MRIASEIVLIVLEEKECLLDKNVPALNMVINIFGFPGPFITITDKDVVVKIVLNIKELQRPTVTITAVHRETISLE